MQIPAICPTIVLLMNLMLAISADNYCLYTVDHRGLNSTGRNLRPPGPGAARTPEVAPRHPAVGPSRQDATLKYATPVRAPARDHSDAAASPKRRSGHLAGRELVVLFSASIQRRTLLRNTIAFLFLFLDPTTRSPHCKEFPRRLIPMRT